MADGPRALSRTTEQAGRFVRLDTIRWRGADGVDREWEAAERTGNRQAVLLIPRLLPSDRLLLIRQYRPPVDAYVVEFPAGLIDGGEEPAAAGLRELHEETGYRGRIVEHLPPACNSPGLSSEAVHVLLIEVDETAPENRDARPTPDPGEHIEVLPVPVADAGAFLRDELRRGTRFDSKVTAYLLGGAGERP